MEELCSRWVPHVPKDLSEVITMLDVANSEWYDAERFRRIEADRLHYDFGEKVMRELCVSGFIHVEAIQIAGSV